MDLRDPQAKEELMTGKPQAGLDGTTGGAEGLKGDNGDKAEELDSFDSAGGRWRLGGTIHDKGN